MKKHLRHIIIIPLLCMAVFSVSCKNDNRSPGNNEDIPDYEDHPIKDTTSPEHIADPAVDKNMQNQSDTHGRDTDAGDTGTRNEDK